jgi:hypothetical protein
MNPIRWNILGVIIGLLIINLPPFIFSLGIEKMNQENFTQMIICLTIGLFGFVILGNVKLFSWLRKVYVAGVILALLSNGINFFLLVKSNAFKSELSKYADLKTVKDLNQIKDSSYYQFVSDIKPDFDMSGIHEKQLRKATKLYSFHHVYPIIEEDRDSVRYFFGCITHNGMMGVSLEKYQEILSDGNRVVQLTHDPGYSNALDSLRIKNKLPIAKQVFIFSVTDPQRVKGLMNEYLLISMCSFNGLYLFLLLLFNLKVKNEKLNID